VDFEGSPVLAPVRPADRENDFAALAALLWSERDLLGELSVAASDRAEAPGEVEMPALVRLGELEVLRAIEAETLAENLGLPSDASLAELASAAPPPWWLILQLHRDALRHLMAACGAFRQLSLEEFLR
jgi:hypothetical protein